MAIEIRPASVVDRRGPRVLVAGGELDVPERDTGVEGRHNEGGAQHVWMDDPETRSLADGANPAVCRTTVQAAAVPPAQDRTFASLANGEVDGSSRAGEERDDRRLVALADDAERPIRPLARSGRSY